MNRAIYESAILHDPAEQAPDPWTRSAGWNGKLVYTHGGGCRSGWYQQGRSTGGVLRDGLLDRGYGGDLGVAQCLRPELQRPAGV